MKETVKYLLSEKSIINLLLLLVFFLYVKKLPIDIETQPFILFFTSIILILFTKINISKTDYWLVFYVLVLTMYFVVQFIIKQTGLIAYLTFLVGPLAYLVFKNKVHLFSGKLIKWIIVIYATVAVIIFFKIPLFYEIVKFFYSFFIPRSGWMDGSEIRGITLFAPEPSYFAFFSVLLLACLDIVSLRGVKVFKYKAVLVAIVIISKSALVFIYTGFYLLFFYLDFGSIKSFFKVRSRKIIFITVSVVILILPFLLFEQSRIAQVFTNIYQNLTNKESFEKLLLTEVSGSTRFIMNTLGYMSVEDAPFGWGLGEFQNNYHIVGHKFHSLMSQHGELSYDYLNKLPLKAQTYLANLVGDIGVFSLPLFLFLFLSLFQQTNNQIKRALKLLILLMLVFVQAQISNPVPWILLAILNSKRLT